MATDARAERVLTMDKNTNKVWSDTYNKSLTELQETFPDASADTLHRVAIHDGYGLLLGDLCDVSNRLDVLHRLVAEYTEGLGVEVSPTVQLVSFSLYDLRGMVESCISRALDLKHDMIVNEKVTRP